MKHGPQITFIVKILNFLKIKLFDKCFYQKFPIPTFYNTPFLAFLHTSDCFYSCRYSSFWECPIPSLYRRGMKMTRRYQKLHDLKNKSRNNQK